MARSNMYPGSCYTCHARVDANAGYAMSLDGQWVVYCKPCSGVNESAKPAVSVTMRGAEAMIAPKGFLGGDVFAQYRDACSGSMYSGGLRANLAPIASIAGILAALAKAGFVVDVSPDVQATVQATRATAQAAVQGASARADIVNAALAKRGMALFPFQVDGVTWLAPMACALLADDMGLGKAQPLTSKVLTPSGWKLMGDLQLGDEVVDPDGGVGLVEGIYPQGERDVYRVTTSDGASTECCEEHLWSVETPIDRNRGRAGGLRTMPLRAFMNDLRSKPSGSDGRTHRKWLLPIMRPASFIAAGPLPLAPYVLGVLLGDGTLGYSRVSYMKPDIEIARKIEPLLPSGVHLNSVGSPLDSVWSIVRNDGERRNCVLDTLRSLGIMGKLSYEKSIPADYMRASIADRLELLRGLMDTDGDCTSDGTATFNTSSPYLRDDVTELARSLGGITTISYRDAPEYQHNGETRIGRPAWRINVRLPVNPFSLPRKAERWSEPTMARGIESVERVGRAPMQCIRVSTRRHLYVTDGHIVTHNTIQALIALPDDAAVVVVCPAVAKGVWLREIAKWRPDYIVTVLDGRGSFRAPKPGEIIVTNYDILDREPIDLDGYKITRVRCAKEALCMVPVVRWSCAPSLALGTPWARCSSFNDGVPHAAPRVTANCPVVLHRMTGVNVIADEAHLLKNRKTIRSAAFRCIADPARESGGKVWLLTATPILNSPMELWNVFEAAGLERVAFGSFSAFRRLFDGHKGGFGGFTWGAPDTAGVVARLAKVMLRRTKVEVLKDLPAKRWREITVDIDAGTRALLDQIDVADVLEKIRAGASLDFKKISAARAALAKAKIAALVELVDEYAANAEPVVVFSAHLAPVELLAKRPGWALITGATSPEKRSEIERDFQAGKYVGVACTIKAGGVAITLTRAANAIFVDSEWTPALNDQAEDRIYRIGQSRAVLITSLVADHALDLRVTELLTEKRRIINASVEAARVTTIPTQALVDVDFDGLAAAAKIELEAAQAVRDAAATRAAEYAALPKPERRGGAAGASGGAGGGHGGGGSRPRRVIVPVAQEGSRAAVDAREVWAQEALATLAGLDPDRARQRNDMGFSAGDGTRGHRLAAHAPAVGLTDEQWAEAIDMCAKYWRQVGRPPGWEKPARVRKAKTAAAEKAQAAL